MLWRLTRFTIRVLDRVADRILGKDRRLAHQRTGRRGEEEAYFRLAEAGLGNGRAELPVPAKARRDRPDRVGWRHALFYRGENAHDPHVKTAEAALDQDKQYELRAVAREYLRRLPSDLNWHFDLASVYFENAARGTSFELFKNAFPVT